MIFEVGTPSPNEATQPNLKTTSGSGASQSGTGIVPSLSKAPSKAHIALTVHSSGYWQTWYRDPIYLTVNSVLMEPTGTGTELSYRLCTAHYALSWYSPSGWYLVSNNWTNIWNSRYSESYSYTDYENDVFCLRKYTNANYEPNLVAGMANGNLFGYTFSVLSGYCTNLLSFHYKIVRTLN